MIRWQRHRDERGALAPAVPILALMLLALAGLGIDGSRQLNARGEATAYAEEASRAGAQGVDIDAQELTLDPAMVQERITTYCAAILEQEQVTECQWVPPVQAVSPDDPRQLVVEVEVKTEIKTSLLSIVGLHTLDASATAKARPYVGIETPLNEP